MSERALRPIDPTPPQLDISLIFDVVVKGDLSRLTPEQQGKYYLDVCAASGCDPRTQPFEYIKLNGKLVLYARKGATDQIRSRLKINIVETRFDYPDGLVVVTVTGEDMTGRRDTEIGVVPINNLQGEMRANALMKALTKAKRRLTLAMSGLGMLDETEVETIPSARPYTPPSDIIPARDMLTGKIIDHDTGEITESPRKSITDTITMAPPRQKVTATPVDDDEEGGPDPKRLSACFALAGSRGLAREDVKTIAYAKYDVRSMKALSLGQLQEFYGYLRDATNEQLFEAIAEATQTTTDAEYREVEG